MIKKKKVGLIGNIDISNINYKSHESCLQRIVEKVFIKLWNKKYEWIM